MPEGYSEHSIPLLPFLGVRKEAWGCGLAILLNTFLWHLRRAAFKLEGGLNSSCPMKAGVVGSVRPRLEAQSVILDWLLCAYAALVSTVEIGGV